LSRFARTPRILTALASFMYARTLSLPGVPADGGQQATSGDLARKAYSPTDYANEGVRLTGKRHVCMQLAPAPTSRSATGR
jgi:hypothetical protein